MTPGGVHRQGSIRDRQDTRIEPSSVKSYVVEYVNKVEPGQILVIHPSE